MIYLLVAIALVAVAFCYALHRTDKVVLALAEEARAERASLLERIQHPERIQLPEQREVEPFEPPDLSALAQVGTIEYEDEDG